MRCCRAEQYDNWCADVEIVHTDADGREYCLFHAPAGCKGAIEAAAFNARVFERIDRAGGGECLLGGTALEWDIAFEKYGEGSPLPQVSFEGARFAGSAGFQGVAFAGDAVFNDAIFMSGAWFNKATFGQDVAFEHAAFAGAAGFTGARCMGGAWLNHATFGGHAGFAEVEFSGDAAFEGAQFSGEAGFDSAAFGGNAQFADTEFMADAALSRMSIAGDAWFTSAVFKGSAGFGGTVFRGNAWFSEAAFGADAWFAGVKFEQDAGFDRAKFAASAGFADARFAGRVEFTGTSFDGHALFPKAAFDGELVVEDAVFRRMAFFYQARVREGRFERVRFEGEASMKQIRVERALWFEDMGMERVSFMHADPERMQFSRVRWAMRGGRALIYDETAAEEAVGEELHGWTDQAADAVFPRAITVGELGPVREIYRRLKLKHRAEGDEAGASAWHWGEKEMRWRTTGLMPNPLEFIALSVYRESSRYAEAPLRALVVLALLIVGLSAGMSAAGMMPTGGQMGRTGYWYVMVNAFKYATFQKDLHLMPKGLLGEALRVATQVLVPLQTALLALALRNRFRR